MKTFTSPAPPTLAPVSPRLADLFGQIGHDERVHKLESLARMEEPRFR